jgi:hypothetical protein
VFCAVNPSAEELLADHWQLILLGGQQVGNVHLRSFAQEEGWVRTELYQSMALRRFGQSFSLSQKDTWLESGGFGADGTRAESVERVEAVILMNGQRQEISAEAQADGLKVRRREGQRISERLLATAAPVLGPYYSGRRIAEAVAAGETVGQPRSLRFQVFSPETGTIEEVEVAVRGAGELEDTLGNAHRGILVEQRSSALPGIVSREVYTGDGFLLYSRTDVGVPLELIGLDDAASAVIPATGPTAGVPAGSGDGGPLAPSFQSSPPELELFDVAAFVIPVSVGPSQAGALCARRKLRLTFSGDGVVILVEALEASRMDLGGRGPWIVEQPAARPRVVVVELAAPAPPERLLPPKEGLSGLDQELQTYMRDGFHLGLDDPRLESLLRQCPSRESVCLERTVDRFLNRKSFGHGFAGLTEVLDTREGDCTEAALLLTALLRKLGVPARLAYGLLLTEVGFIGHAWTEAYQDGRWYWLDPSFPGGAPYGLKLRLGTLDPAEPVWGQLGTALLTLSSNLRIELVAPEQPP